MDLAVVTPTRKRWPWLVKQAKRLAPQLKPDDRWIVVIDNDQTPVDIVEPLNDLIGCERLVWCLLSYYRPDPPEARVNFARNAGAALAPKRHAIVELDDHDLLELGALDAVRETLNGGAQYAFGWYKQEALIAGPDGRQYLETWPHVKPAYHRGWFGSGTIGDGGAGLRAIRRELWDGLRGWDTDVWPAADRDFARRAEAIGAEIVSIPQFLCTVLIDPQGISARYRGNNPRKAAA